MILTSAISVLEPYTLNYQVELFSWVKHKILLPHAPKLFSEYPSFHHPSWLQTAKSYSMGSREKQTFIQIPGLCSSYEPATISTRLQKNIPTPKPFEQGIKDILFEKSMGKQMSKWVQSGAAAINDAMINDSKYLGYS